MTQKQTVAVFSLLALVVSFLPVSKTLAQSLPENRCFDLMMSKARSNPVFGGVDFRRVKKINGKNERFKSGAFSVASYNDFLTAFGRDIPTQPEQIVYYPDNLNGNVAPGARIKRQIHKANRNNVGTVNYNHDIPVGYNRVADPNDYFEPIKHWVEGENGSPFADLKAFWAGQKTEADLDAKHIRQKINGYYLNTKYVTFGRESNLAFSFPSRAARPAADSAYPSGRPVKDMREYVMYVSHLAPRYGGDFMGCGLISMVPQGGYVLKDYERGGFDDIDWPNYGGIRMSESNSLVENAASDFKLGTVEYTVTDRQLPRPGNLLRFYTMALAYNNQNSFMNSYVTLPLFNEAMLDPQNARLKFLQMRRAFYQKIIDSGLGIGADASVVPVSQGTYVPHGGWCGMGATDVSAPFFRCQGMDPRAACPDGYVKKIWSVMGASRWITCFKQSSGLLAAGNTVEGNWCGVTLSGDPSRAVACAGQNVQQGCPDGYQSVRFAFLPNNGGEWRTCAKRDLQVGEVEPAGSWCGLKMEHRSGVVHGCGAHDPQVSCPNGYTSRLWTNIAPTWGRWYSCFKD